MRNHGFGDERHFLLPRKEGYRYSTSPCNSKSHEMSFGVTQNNSGCAIDPYLLSLSEAFKSWAVLHFFYTTVVVELQPQVNLTSTE